jgi:hypothetical protein
MIRVSSVLRDLFLFPANRLAGSEILVQTIAVLQDIVDLVLPLFA